MQIIRRTAPGLVAVLLFTGIGATACGGGDGLSKSDLASKIKEDPELKDLSDASVECLAGVYIKYGDKQELQDVIDGKKDPDEEVKGIDLNNKDLQQEITDCMKK